MMSLPASTEESEFGIRLKKLYPAVDEHLTPLPRKWNNKDKYNFITLSHENLKVTYKGQGKSHRDAASVRASYPIPASCGIYYFEVSIVSKGRDGYMGIGLSAKGVNLNRLPGWDKHSYGYHGDDGHSFCATGTGQSYGPTFTTGDVVGCCLNMVDNSCFYTKNGLHIGTAFRNLPSLPLYPTVGLQTPNEELSVNFGQQPFVFDFEDYLKEWRKSSKDVIERFQIKEESGNLQSILHKLVSSYLIHHGYVGSAEAFNNSAKQGLDHYEEITSIKNRQKIQKLVLDGRIGEAIETTDQCFPGLLAKNTNLLFLLKVRQFIEIVNGTDSEVRSLTRRSSVSSNYNSPVTSPKHLQWSQSASNSPASSHNGFSPPQHLSGIYQGKLADMRPVASMPSGDSLMPNDAATAEYSKKSVSGSSSECDMETDSDEGGNGKGDPSNGFVANGFSSCKNSNDQDIAMNEYPPPLKQLCGGNPIAIERLLQFGQQLFQISSEIKPKEIRDKNLNILYNAYYLLAYTNPWNSTVGYQLDPVQREPICAALNSKILESQNLPKKPPLLTMIGQTQQCLRKMLLSDIGSAAFLSVSEYM